MFCNSPRCSWVRDRVAPIHDGEAVEGGHDALIPFCVRQEHKAIDRVGILKKDSILLLLLVQNIVDPSDAVATLVALDIWEHHLAVDLGRLLDATRKT